MTEYEHGPLPPSTRRLGLVAEDHGVPFLVRRFPEGTKTAGAAADAVGCPVAAIVKSLVFIIEGPGSARRPVLALVPGDRRLDTNRLAAMAGGDRAVRASLDEVRDSTGFAAGGTPPFGHDLPVYADEALRRHSELWAAGGTPDTVFPISIDDLSQSTAAIWGQLS